MQITYNLTEEDQKKYISTNFEPKKISPRKIIILIAAIFFFFLALIFLIISDYPWAIIMFAIAILYCYLLYGLPKKYKKKYLDKLTSTGVLKETKTIEVNDGELRFTSPSRTVIHQYSDIKDISIINNYFIIIIFKHEDSIAIPKSAFSNNTEMIDFINQIKTNAKIL